MILINLLPHREERRKQRKRAFFVGLGVAAGTGLVVAGLWYGALQQMTQAQQARNSFLRDEIAKLEAQIKDIATLRAEIDTLVLISNCPQINNPCNGFDPTSVRVVVRGTAS